MPNLMEINVCEQFRVRAKMKKGSEATQTLRTGWSKADPQTNTQTDRGDYNTLCNLVRSVKMLAYFLWTLHCIGSWASVTVLSAIQVFVYFIIVAVTFCVRSGVQWLRCRWCHALYSTGGREVSSGCCDSSQVQLPWIDHCIVSISLSCSLF